MRYSYHPGIADAVGARVRERRSAANLSQETVGLRAHVADSTVSRVETGSHCPSIDSLLMLAHALNCEPAQLLPTLEEARRLLGVSP